MVAEIVDTFGLVGPDVMAYAASVTSGADADDLFCAIMNALNEIGDALGEDELEWHVQHLDVKRFAENRGLHLKYKEA